MNYTHLKWVADWCPNLWAVANLCIELNVRRWIMVLSISKSRVFQLVNNSRALKIIRIRGSHQQVFQAKDYWNNIAIKWKNKFEFEVFTIKHCSLIFKEIGKSSRINFSFAPRWWSFKDCFMQFCLKKSNTR